MKSMMRVLHHGTGNWHISRPMSISVSAVNLVNKSKLFQGAGYINSRLVHHSAQRETHTHTERDTWQWWSQSLWSYCSEPPSSPGRQSRPSRTCNSSTLYTTCNTHTHRRYLDSLCFTVEPQYDSCCQLSHPHLSPLLFLSYSML